jgi:osmotically-inducible protein OsmY
VQKAGHLYYTGFLTGRKEKRFIKEFNKSWYKFVFHTGVKLCYNRINVQNARRNRKNAKKKRKEKERRTLWLRSLVATLYAVPLWAPWAQLLPVC